MARGKRNARPAVTEPIRGEFPQILDTSNKALSPVDGKKPPPVQPVRGTAPLDLNRDTSKSMNPE